MKTTLLVLVTFVMWNEPTLLYSQVVKGDSIRQKDLTYSAEVLTNDGPSELSQENSVGLEKEPVVITRVDPEYPGLAIRAAMEGKVIVSALVDVNGTVVETRIVKSSDKVFEGYALEAARLWTFTPGVSKGKPVAVWVTIPFQFVLPSPAKGNSKAYATFVASLQEIAMNIIHGKRLEQVKATIEPGAYIIDGNHYENLYAVLNGEIKTCSVVEGSGSEVSYFHAYLTDEMTAASLVLKTTSANGKRVRFHTVLIIRQPGGEWKIKSWHVSG